MTTTVAMDTNALMMPVELDVRVFEELDRILGGAHSAPESASGQRPLAGGYECVVPEAVVDELRKLAGGHGTEATAASVGRDLADRCRIVETDESYADDAIVELATAGEADCVVTNDRPLRDRLLERGVRVIGLRGRDTLGITEP